MAYQVLAFLLVFLLTALPGIVFSFAILRGIKLNKLDKIILGIIIGQLLPAIMGFVEYAILGVPFSSGLVMINLLLILLVSVILIFAQRQVSFDFSALGRFLSPDYYSKKFAERPAIIAIYAILLFFMGAAFYVRFATAWNPRFFEFDPFYYDETTQFLVLQGSDPLHSDMAFYPRDRSFRELPMIHYMTGGWYLLYSAFTQTQYDMDTMIRTIQFYPPLAGLFLAFLAFLFIREESNEYIGLIAAAMFAFTPQLVKKLGAGVSEQQPFGMFTALLVFALYALAINRKSWRLGILAILAIISSNLGSAHFTWVAVVLASFIFLASLLEFYSSGFEFRDFMLNLGIALGALFGTLLFYSYTDRSLGFGGLPIGTIALMVAPMPALIHFVSERIGFTKKLSKNALLSLMGVILIIALFITPLGQAVSMVSSLVSYAKADSPLSRTIQEEGATSPGLYVSSFGVLNPDNLLEISAILLILLASISLRKKGQWIAAAYGVSAMAFVLFNSYVDYIFKFAASLSSGFSPQLAAVFNLIVESDVFIFMLISVLSLAIQYHLDEKKNKMTLLFLLVFFPTAYIGLNKVKYLVHLAFALALALPFVLLKFEDLMTGLNGAFRVISDEAALRKGLLVFIILIGAVMAYGQFDTTKQSMAELQYSTMSGDWIDATNWMRSNMGLSYRIISWWDYGHWIAFLGGTKSVLDPGNAYPEYDQLTAKAFVEDDPANLIKTMHYFNATHILVDSELVQKWGALVYLSGTFTGLSDSSLFDRPGKISLIKQTSLPGQSEYETEHYFEYLYAVYRQSGSSYQPAACPGVIQRQMLYSSFGALYCIDSKQNLFLLNQAGDEKQINDPRLIYAGGGPIAAAPLGSSGLYYDQRFSFINLNPDLTTLTDKRLNSKLIKSAFVNLFFYEKLDGFQLSYKSPNGQVKIFKLLV